MKNWRMLFCLMALACTLLFPPNGSPCGPDFPQAVFVFQTHPDRPLKGYAGGNLGVVLPSYYRSYLVVAYRYFSGHPLSREERDDALSYWGWDMSGGYGANKGADPIKEWLAARKQVLNSQNQGSQAEPKIDSYFGVSQPGAYYGFFNCLDDSFHNAARTLKDRARRYGSDRASIQEWVRGQDIVFSDCDKQRDIPPEVAGSSPAWLKADRQYQIAAAYFYLLRFDHAAEEFDRIARDAGSPWHNLAPYLAARAMIRQSMVPEPVQMDSLRDAESRLQRILADPAQSSMHQPARAMLGFVALRLHLPQRTAELARRLAGPRPDSDFYQDLTDYTWSMDHIVEEPPIDFPGEMSDPGRPDGDGHIYEGPAFDRKMREWKGQRFRNLAGSRATTELTDWILTFGQSVEPAARHAIERWRVKRSLPWLVAALSKVDSAEEDLLQAAEQVPADSPAYATVAYHRIRLLMKAGEHEKARALLDEFLKAPPRSLNDSSLNLFLSQRARLATSYQDFLSRAPRLVLDLDEGDSIGGEAPYCQTKGCMEILYGGPNKRKGQLRLDNDAAWILNLRLPVDMLAEAATGTDLPEPLRGELAVATWTRAVMLDRPDIAGKLIPEMEKAYPLMTGQLQAYSASGADEKKEAGLFVILHFPGMRPYVNAGVARTTRMDKIDNFRDNWWCGDVGTEIDQVNFVKDWRPWRPHLSASVPKDAPSAPPFLSMAQQKDGEAQWQQLATSGPGSRYLTREALAWAKAKPLDPRVPEALHLAVRSTRYGCGGDVSKLSHQAFTLLHEKYPNSKWAKATPFWY
jgi:tetratricopeptide (TPR) repeat protein